MDVGGKVGVGLKVLNPQAIPAKARTTTAAISQNLRRFSIEILLMNFITNYDERATRISR